MRGSRSRKRVDVDLQTVDQVDVVDRGRADEQAGLGTRQLRHLVPGVLDRFPDGLQKDALLRVHHLRFPR